MKETIGFIGLGNMGKPMALNLQKAGYGLLVHDINPAPVEELRKAGASVAGNCKEVASVARVVITMLPNSGDVENAILGENGVLSGAKESSIIIDMSTIDPGVSRKVAGELAKRGVKMLDAPVSGGQMRAKDGTLAIMVGGAEDTFLQCKDIFAAMGKSLHYCGGSGNGSVAKVTNNLIAAIAGLGSAEALALGVKAGVDLKVLYEVINASSGQNWAMQYYFSAKAFKNDVEPGFAADLMYKDVGLAMNLAKEQGVPLFVGGLAYQMYSQVRALGLGKRDSSVVAKIIEDWAGIKMRLE